jgi:hypothetical protein
MKKTVKQWCSEFECLGKVCVITVNKRLQPAPETGVTEP